MKNSADTKYIYKKTVILIRIVLKWVFLSSSHYYHLMVAVVSCKCTTHIRTRPPQLLIYIEYIKNIEYFGAGKIKFQRIEYSGKDYTIHTILWVNACQYIASVWKMAHAPNASCHQNLYRYNICNALNCATEIHAWYKWYGVLTSNK